LMVTTDGTPICESSQPKIGLEQVKRFIDYRMKRFICQ
jgi:hypothetical protein